MAEIDIRALTKEAEAGNGCAVQRQLEPLSFEESLRTLKQIANQNTTDRAADPNTSKLAYYGRGYPDSASVSLLIKTSGDWLWHGIVEDELYLNDTSNRKIDERKFDCNNTSFK
jgi:hypothetical protein